MIEINLLPEEMRKVKLIREMRFLNKKSLIIGLGCLVLFHIFLCTLAASSERRMVRLEQNWQDMGSQRKIIMALKQELSEINKKIPLIEGLISNRILWSEKLNLISNLLVGGVWLTNLSLVEKQVSTAETSQLLIIKGSAASRTQEEPALIGKFMQNLKEETVFARDFEEIELGPIKKRRIGKTEVMDFILICRFKADKAKGLLK